jgi:cellulose synthase/poly-beta-1,6-N-acetylglucosamine synthase-like glycosyltransferase
MAWVIFWCSAGIAFHFLIGYPLLLRFLPFRPRPVAKDLAFRPPVTILMAVHNGADFIIPKLESLLGLEYPRDGFEIVILDDQSSDATVELAASFAASHNQVPIEIIRLKKGGKAAALNAGLARQNREILFFTDVRQPLHPAALQHLASNFADPSVGAVTGELRFLSSGHTTDEQATMDLYWRYELWVREQHSLRDSLFNTTGCIYAMRRQWAHPIPDDSLTDDALLPLGAYFAGKRIVFEAQALAYDYPHREGGEWGRRMRTLAGMWQTYARHPRLLLDPRRMWFHFLSHKLGRVLLPWTLLINIGATFALPPSVFRSSLIAGNLLLATLALGSRWSKPTSLLHKIGSRAHTFLSMNLAALASTQVFFRDPRKLWQPSKVLPISRLSS